MSTLSCWEATHGLMKSQSMLKINEIERKILTVPNFNKKKFDLYLYGHSSPLLHSPFTQNEHMCGRFRL